MKVQAKVDIGLSNNNKTNRQRRGQTITPPSYPVFGSISYLEYIYKGNDKMNTVKNRAGRMIKVVAGSEHSNFISSNDEEMDARAVEAVRAAVSKAKFCQNPITRYDTKTKSVYVEYADRELPLEKIAKYSNLTLEQVKELSQLKEDAFKIFMEKMDFAEKSIAEQGYYTEQEVEKELESV